MTQEANSWEVIRKKYIELGETEQQEYLRNLSPSQRDHLSNLIRPAPGPGARRPLFEQISLLNRVTASLISLVAPWAMIFIAALFVGAVGGDWTNTPVVPFAGLLGYVLRVYYAYWYVKDKVRHGAWAAASIAGIWGWIVLWLLQDRSVTGADSRR